MFCPRHPSSLLYSQFSRIHLPLYFSSIPTNHSWGQRVSLTLSYHPHHLPPPSSHLAGVAYPYSFLPGAPPSLLSATVVARGKPAAARGGSGGGGAWRGVVRHGRSSDGGRRRSTELWRGGGADPAALLPPLRRPCPYARAAHLLAAELSSRRDGPPRGGPPWPARQAPRNAYRAPPSSTPAFRHRERRRWQRALPGLLRLLPADRKHEEAPEREIRSCLRRLHPPLRLRRRLGRRAQRPWVRGPHATSLFP
jgi:hypothetical protein